MSTAGAFLQRCSTSVAALFLLLACSQVDVVTLGRNATPMGDAAVERDAAVAPERFEFEPPVLVEALYSETKDDNPTLTWDLKEIYFSSTRSGDSTDLWWASRESASDSFGTPLLLEEFSTSGFDASPAIEGDGLTLWFSQDRDDGLGGLDIYRAERSAIGQPWQASTLVGELSSDADDIPRPTGAQGLVMPLSSRRLDGDYLIYAAHRPSPDDAFETPRLLEELVLEGNSTADAFLTDDGLTLFYSHASPDAGGDLFVASRQSLDDPFSDPRPLDDLNTANDERDPWLSPDGATMFFASDRNGSLAIYQANRRN